MDSKKERKKIISLTYNCIKLLVFSMLTVGCISFYSFPLCANSKTVCSGANLVTGEYFVSNSRFLHLFFWIFFQISFFLWIPICPFFLYFSPHFSFLLATYTLLLTRCFSQIQIVTFAVKKKLGLLSFRLQTTHASSKNF